MAVTDIIVRFKTEMGNFNTVMGKNLTQFQQMQTRSGEINKRFKDMRTSGGRLATRIRHITHGFRGFRMEMLGIMFFGMGMQRMFGGLLKPTLELVGAFQVMNNALAFGLLPTGDKLLGWALKLQDWMLDLDPVMQEAIGSLTLWGYGVGIAGQTLGTMALGLASTILIFRGATATVLLFVAGIALIILAVLLIIWLWKNWDKISWKVKLAIAAIAIVIGVILYAMGAWIGWIFLVIAAVVAIIAVIKDWRKWLDWLKEKWQAFKSWFAKTKFGQAMTKIVDKIKAAWKSFFDWLSDKWNKLKGFYSKITAPVKKFFGGGIPSSQFGGFVPQTGLRLVHAGETVIPSSQNLNFNPTVNITSGVGGGVDANMIKSELNEMWARQLANLARR
tara:strand:+ start:651 stop:1820 length:1170 start_codon:yes stop_codon:yes gene_type:complete